MENENVRVNRTDAELRQLAVDVADGKVFHDRMVAENDDPFMSFMVLKLMDDDQLTEWLDQAPALVYEYLAKAGPRAINGYPTFFSFQWLNEMELEIFAPMVTELLEAKKAFVTGVNA